RMVIVSRPRSVPSVCGRKDHVYVRLSAAVVPTPHGVGGCNIGVLCQRPSAKDRTMTTPVAACWLASATCAPGATHRVDVHLDRNAHNPVFRERSPVVGAPLTVWLARSKSRR